MPFLEGRGSVELSLDDVLVLEGTQKILEFEAGNTGVPMWPLVRVRFMREILGDLLFSGDLVGQDVSLAPSGKALGALGRYALHNTFAAATIGQVTIMSTALGGQRRDGKWFNRLTDHFAMAHPAVTCVVEDDLHWNYPGPRVFDRVRYNAPNKAAIALAGKALVRTAHYSAATGLVDLVTMRARDAIGWEMKESRRGALINKLAQLSASLPFSLAIYTRLFKALGTRILLKEDGSYGGASLAPVIAARRMGIVTAEYQHGIISKGQDAYNVAPALLTSEAFRACFPEHLLTFGSWWNDKLRVPVQPISVGSPHRSAVIENRPRATDGTEARTDVLILSDGIDADALIGMAAQIAEALSRGGLRVVFRPHPVELDTADWQAKLPRGVHLDPHIDIYDAFETALAVVSEVTTGAFEAIGLVPLVVVRDTPKTRFNYPENPFALFRSIEDLSTLLTNHQTVVAAPGPCRDIWSENWRHNYSNFLRTHGVEI